MALLKRAWAGLTSLVGVVEAALLSLALLALFIALAPDTSTRTSSVLFVLVEALAVVLLVRGGWRATRALWRAKPNPVLAGTTPYHWLLGLTIALFVAGEAPHQWVSAAVVSLERFVHKAPLEVQQGWDCTHETVVRKPIEPMATPAVAQPPDWERVARELELSRDDVRKHLEDVRLWVKTLDERATSVVDTGLPRSPEELHHDLGQAYMELAQFDLARIEFQRIDRDIPPHLDRPAARLAFEARVRLADQTATDASSFLQDAYANGVLPDLDLLYPVSSPTLRLRDLERQLQKYPDDDYYWGQYAEHFYGDNDYEKAYAAYLRAYALNNDRWQRQLDIVAPHVELGSERAACPIKGRFSLAYAVPRATLDALDSGTSLLEDYDGSPLAWLVLFFTVWATVSIGTATTLTAEGSILGTNSARAKNLGLLLVMGTGAALSVAAIAAMNREDPSRLPSDNRLAETIEAVELDFRLTLTEARFGMPASSGGSQPAPEELKSLWRSALLDLEQQAAQRRNQARAELLTQFQQERRGGPFSDTEHALVTRLGVSYRDHIRAIHARLERCARELRVTDVFVVRPGAAADAVPEAGASDAPAGRKGPSGVGIVERIPQRPCPHLDIPLPASRSDSENGATGPAGGSRSVRMGLLHQTIDFLIEEEIVLIVGMLGFGLFGSAISQVVRGWQRRRALKTEAELDAQPLAPDLMAVVMMGTSAAFVVYLAAMGGLSFFASGTAAPNPDRYALMLSCFVAAVYSDRIWSRAQDFLSSADDDVPPALAKDGAPADAELEKPEDEPDVASPAPDTGDEV